MYNLIKISILCKNCNEDNVLNLIRKTDLFITSV